MPIKGYIAGRPVSRWEAETDNIDIDYRNLDGHGLGPCGCIEECQTGKKGCALKILVCIVIVFVGIFIGYVIGRNIQPLTKQESYCPALAPVAPSIQDYNKTLTEMIKKKLEHIPNYNQSLKAFPSSINLAGMPLTNEELVATKRWLEMFNFDSVRMKSYEVMLEYADFAAATPNYVVMEENGTEVFHSHSNITADHREYLAFSAYSASKAVTGKLVYVNYGSVEDFGLLESKGVLVNNSIVILRYGKIHPGSKVKHAQDRGALGVILYSDPYDFANKQASASPGTWWLPSWAIKSCHVRPELSGDPSTTHHQYLDGSLEIVEKNSSFAKIPVHPISYSDAKELLKDLGGELVSQKWKGSLPVEYRSGPGFRGEAENRTVKLEVANKSVKRTIYNLIAVIRGQHEKDQYVIVGAHHDSWTWGAIDAGSGNAVLIELAKTFAQKTKTGWRPRRTIIFAFWDASKYGQIGAYKWAMENAKQLEAGAVAYINLDSLIRGNHSFYAESSPMLADVILQAAQSVPCADPQHGPGMSVYDMWAGNFPRPGTDPAYPQPNVPLLGGDSDYAPFLYLLGVPSLSPVYTYNLNAFDTLPNYPAYGTLDDTYDYLLRYIDPDLRLHATMSKVIAEVTMRLADSAILPLRVSRLEDLLEEGWDYLQAYSSDMENVELSLVPLRYAINDFKNSAENFTAVVSAINVTKARESDIRTINDQLLRVSRAFLTNRGLPGAPQYRHSLISPHPENLNGHIVFPGISWPLLRGQTVKDWSEVERQLELLITSLKNAQDILDSSMIS
ncbi:putative N-acetylated-alpha-linked acidic dipeptidase [Liolophura sinensis]|uniref:putative N-acetylated-alpha-linked acidic dipeptidase n=1 Tax=Liolophura sinensis TaxID=3198878 RepID=UPI0031583FD7